MTLASDQPLTLGILGGGQLAQMLALAATPLGVRVLVLEPDPQAPARVCSEHIQAPYTDHTGLDALAGCSAVTLEFENVPVAALDYLQGKVAVRPGAELLHISKHRSREKQALQAAGAGTAPFVNITAASDLSGALAFVGGAGILKTSELGYDGKGQARINSDTELQATWDDMGQVPCVLEGLVNFRREVSLGVARTLTEQGEQLVYGGLIENTHRNGILRRSLYLPQQQNSTQQARLMAADVARAWNLEGLMTLEFFELPDGTLLVNEVAPRVHNSGHLTQNGGGHSQFEMQVRAALRLPLHDFAPLLPCAMVNILGWDDPQAAPQYQALQQLEGVFLHLYGKANRPGRKLGHVNIVAHSEEALRQRLAQVEALIP